MSSTARRKDTDRNTIRDPDTVTCPCRGTEVRRSKDHPLCLRICQGKLQYTLQIHLSSGSGNVAVSVPRRWTRPESTVPPEGFPLPSPRLRITYFSLTGPFLYPLPVSPSSVPHASHTSVLRRTHILPWRSSLQFTFPPLRLSRVSPPRNIRTKVWNRKSDVHSVSPS